MFVTLRKMVVTEGNGDKVTERFGSPGVIEEQEVFVDLTVMKQKAKRGEEEVIVLMRWESEQHWKQWEKSEVHIAMHKANLGKPKPEYIISAEGGRYEVQAVKTAAEK
ncbi:antibiotic biosynthesis monooxygenase [Evansella sp. LMS18]|jgi:heme oxygenase (staphylobilin-producing)|uniref:antibiotic biosynthesis monooxygenase n=1 Tax=Evansella sp. LMS18 TaxID=2924033 RepID=UPI0020D14524|nr:antibiotic biosynthesis monooxygenase [Evansella sp. LMS18]UTR12638.1 antibiotic biosynthesis monooxygenase [Evansella sp. LMS18]